MDENAGFDELLKACKAGRHVEVKEQSGLGGTVRGYANAIPVDVPDDWCVDVYDRKPQAEWDHSAAVITEATVTREQACKLVQAGAVNKGNSDPCSPR